MQTYLRDQIDWPQAFPAEEYASRRARVRAALAEAGLDAIFVTSPANITWLTGYDMIWYHLESLTGLLVMTDAGPQSEDGAVFFDGRAHTTIISTTPEIREVVWFGEAPDVEVIAGAIAQRGLGGKRIGLERWGYAPHASVMDRLAETLTAQGSSIDNAWALIEQLRMVKSELEVAHVRTAAAIADQAMTAARDAIREGVTETALEGELMASMLKSGGGYPGIRSMIGSGARAGTHHGPPTRRAVKQGDLVFIDFCGCYDRYHVNLNRTFSLGEPDPRWRKLMFESAGCIDAILEQVSVGDLLSKVETVAQGYIDRVGLREHVWWVGGYSLGIAVPPDWCGSHWLQPRFGLDDRRLEPGMVFNLENQFDVWEDWPGGSGAAYIESLLVTEDGMEVLSSLPRELVVV